MLTELSTDKVVISDVVFVMFNSILDVLVQSFLLKSVIEQLMVLDMKFITDICSGSEMVFKP